MPPTYTPFIFVPFYSAWGDSSLRLLPLLAPVPFTMGCPQELIVPVLFHLTCTGKVGGVTILATFLLLLCASCLLLHCSCACSLSLSPFLCIHKWLMLCLTSIETAWYITFRINTFFKLLHIFCWFDSSSITTLCYFAVEYLQTMPSFYSAHTLV